jgi:hypothetical protein
MAENIRLLKAISDVKPAIQTSKICKESYKKVQQYQNQVSIFPRKHSNDNQLKHLFTGYGYNSKCHHGFNDETNLL